MNVLKRIIASIKRRRDERFKKRFERIYPDMAIFADRIQVMQGYEDCIQLRGGFCATGFVSAFGLSTSYREWEDKTIAEIERKYPDLKILAFHYTPEDKSVER